MRILVTDGMDKTAMAQLREQGHEVVEQFYEPDQLGAALRDFDVAVVRSKTKIRKEHIDAAKGGKRKMIIEEGLWQGHRAAGQDPGHRGLRPHRPAPGRDGQGHRHEGHRL